MTIVLVGISGIVIGLCIGAILFCWALKDFAVFR